MDWLLQPWIPLSLNNALLTIFFQRTPSLFSGAENTLEANLQVHDRPMKAAEPELLLQHKATRHNEVNVTRSSVRKVNSATTSRLASRLPYLGSPVLLMTPLLSRQGSRLATRGPG